MGTFNDLPNDIKWLILRRVIIEGEFMIRHAYLWEQGFNSLPMNFADDTSNTGAETKKLALINKACLKVVKSKCYFVFNRNGRRGWMFVKGALTGNYS